MSKRTNLAVMVCAFLFGAVTLLQSQTTAPREISWSEAQKLLAKPFALQYPDEAKANHIDGTVVYKVTVRSNGQYGALVKVSGPSLLGQACLDSIKATTFRPLQVNGHAVAFTTRVPCAFGGTAEPAGESASARNKPLKVIGGIQRLPTAHSASASAQSEPPKPDAEAADKRATEAQTQSDAISLSCSPSHGHVSRSNGTDQDVNCPNDYCFLGDPSGTPEVNPIEITSAAGWKIDAAIITKSASETFPSFTAWYSIRINRKTGEYYFESRTSTGSFNGFSGTCVKANDTSGNKF